VGGARGGAPRGAAPRGAALLGAALLALSACTPPQEALVGAWRVDLEALRRDPLAARAAPPAGPLAAAWREAAYEGWRFVFYADLRAELTLRGVVYRGRYEVSRVLGDVVYLRVEAAPVATSALDAELGLAPTAEPLAERLRVKLGGGGVTLTLDDDDTRQLPLRPASAGL